MKKNIIVVLAAALAMVGCSDSWLDRQYDGAAMSQEKYESLGTAKLEGTLNGLYTMIYTMSSDDHDEFGQRAIDLWGDICSGDIAVTDKKYGWLYTDESMSTINRTGTIWYFYYKMIHNINLTILSIENSGEILSLVEQYGYPNATCQHKYTEEETTYAMYLAQALALRGYCYANLVRWYTPVEKSSIMNGQRIDQFLCVPVYTEDNMDNAQPLATSAAVYNRVFNDLKKSIDMFEYFGAYYKDSISGAEFKRMSKLAMDINVARGQLAYAYLNAAPYYASFDTETAKNYYRKAYSYANDVIESGAYKIIPQAELYSTGFNNVENTSWMWGQDVVTETTGGLRSWFGQMDIHSYSYAWAGDTKVIDGNLKAEIPAWDGRSRWFNDGEKNSKFKDCPDGKFFSAACPTSTNTDDIDREWLSDNVLMRFESMYLIAAEACYGFDSLAASANFLTTITDQRLNDEYPLAQQKYDEFKATLTNQTTLLTAIEYNWRIEMWGEGYGLQTFRRLVPQLRLSEARKRGGNHLVYKTAEIKPEDRAFNMTIPSSETTYNPRIDDK